MARLHFSSVPVHSAEAYSPLKEKALLLPQGALFKLQQDFEGLGAWELCDQVSRVLVEGVDTIDMR